MIDSGKLPVDLQWSERASPKVIIDEAPKDKVPEPAVAQKRRYVTEARVDEHGRTVGCPRCLAESAYTTPIAVDGSKESCCDKAA